MQSFAIVLLLSAILLWPPNSFAQETCFSEDVAGRMVVALEQARIIEQQLAVAETGSAELLQQIDTLKNTIKLLQDQIEIYKNMAEMQARMGEAKDKLFEQQLKAAQPTFMDKVKTNVLAGGIGAALAAVAIFLL
jgi:hypothetical protein